MKNNKWKRRNENKDEERREEKNIFKRDKK